MDIDAATIAPFKNDLNALMERRHFIAHRVDRNPRPRGRGVSKSRPLSKRWVIDWTNTVRAVCESILAELEKKP